MIKLFQFPSCWGLPNASPFCMKVETYLRMTKLPFQVIQVMDPRKAPKGKLPYIEDEGRMVADSGLIIQYLKETYGDTLDVHLTLEQRAHALALQRLMDEHLYFAFLYSRWVDPVNWPQTKQDFFSKLPFLLKKIIPNSVRRKMRSDLISHGLGRHTQAEIYQMGVDDLMVLNTHLSNHPFLMGDVPTSIDACGYAFIANAALVPITSVMNEYAKEQKSFVEYCGRMKKLFY